MYTQNKHIKVIILTLCFLLPALVMIFAFAAYDMAPFGDNSILIMDMSGQYSEFYIGLKHIGKNNNLFFSWSKSLGTNYIGVFAYYLSSPLSFLTFLSSEANMPVFLLFLTVLKIGLCGLTFGIYLSYMFKTSPKIILFSLFYGLMSYNIVYSMCLMWIDGVIWLPVILIGIEELFAKNKIKLLTVSLFAVFVSTYYISYMVGVFSSIYFLYRYITHYSETISIKKIPFKLLRFISSAVIGALLGAWLLLPTLYSLFEGKIGGSNYNPNNKVNFDISNLPSKLFLGSYDSITNNGMPFIYSSILVTILFIGYFFMKKIKITEKLCTLAVAMFLLISMYASKLDIAWHIFQYPNWFPYRYSFVFLFFTIFIAYRAFMSLEDIPLSYYISFPLVGLVVAILVKRINYYYVKEENIKLTVKILILYSIFLVLLYIVNKLKTTKIRLPEIALKRGIPVFLLVLMLSTGCYELYNHSIYLFKGLDRMHYYEKIEPYRLYRNAINELLEDATKNEDENSFYRVSKTFSRSFNEPISFGYNGIAHYSSAYNRKLNDFLRSIGFSSAHLWCTDYGSTIITDALLSVKYMMSVEPETDKYEKIGYKENISLYRKPEDRALYEIPKNITIYKNPNVLSIGFMADSELTRSKISAANFFIAQNRLLRAITGDENADCFSKIMVNIENENSTIDDGNSLKYNRSGQLGIVRYTGVASKDMELYGFFPYNDNSQGVAVYVDGEYITDLFYGQFDCIHFLGSYKEGDNINIELRFRTTSLNVSNNIFYALDYDKFTGIADDLKEGNLEVSYYSAGVIKGTVNAKKDGTLFTSIPYDKGWSIYIDGQKKESKIFSDALLCVDISEGSHNVEFRYTAPGFVPGVTISSLTLAAIIAISLIRLRKRS